LISESELLKQRERSARRARANKNENDRNLLGFLKQSGDASLGKQLGSLEQSSYELAQARADLHKVKKIVVSFELLASRIHKSGDYVVSVRDGSVGYQNLPPLFMHINLHVGAGERVALQGDNGSGKSTLIKAICPVQGIVTNGEWQMPQSMFIGYLDQHYKILDPALSVLEILKAVHKVPDVRLRTVLNDFLFRKNEEVNAVVSQLSGGEKALLALACIAVKQPALLVLDEITNNLDLQTREYVIQVLNQYPGSLVVISHDEDFLNHINLQGRYVIDNGAVKREDSAE
jgi:ATPase subunit of ABC transporter with duplicated ATPase domains